MLKVALLALLAAPAAFAQSRRDTAMDTITVSRRELIISFALDSAAARNREAAVLKNRELLALSNASLWVDLSTSRSSRARARGR